MRLQKNITIDEAQVKFTGGIGQFEGYASVFDVVDAYGDVIEKGSFKKILEANPKVNMFFNHESWLIPVGKWLSLAEDDKGLHVKGELTPNLSRADDLWAAMKHETVTGMSIGIGINKSGYELLPAGGYRIFDIAKLYEISICTDPANEEAQIEALKSLAELETIRDIERWLRESAHFSKTQAQTLIARVKGIAELEQREAVISSDDAEKIIEKIRHLTQRN